MKSKVREVMPVFNRCVVFNTDASSFHGHPDPLQTPEGVFRRSIALYYYTASKEIYNEVPSTSTMYHARPGDDGITRKEARRLRQRRQADKGGGPESAGRPRRARPLSGS